MPKAGEARSSGAPDSGGQGDPERGSRQTVEFGAPITFCFGAVVEVVNLARYMSVCTDIYIYIYVYICVCISIYIYILPQLQASGVTQVRDAELGPRC